jgi:hypothetical protein
MMYRPRCTVLPRYKRTGDEETCGCVLCQKSGETFRKFATKQRNRKGKLTTSIEITLSDRPDAIEKAIAVFMLEGLEGYLDVRTLIYLYYCKCLCDGEPFGLNKS